MARQMKDSGVEWIGEIPEGWGVRKLKYLLECSMQYGANESGIGYNEALPRYIRITDIDSDNNLKTVNKLSLTEQMAEGYILNDNDILFARSGATVGKTFLYKSECGRSAFAGYLIRATLDKKRAIPKFVFYYTLSEGYDLWKNYIFIQSTIQNIGADKYMNLIIPITQTGEQQKIADFLDEKIREIDSVISKTKETIEDYKKYKQAIVTDAVTKGLNPNAEMKESGIEWMGGIPKGWEIKKLKSFTDIISKGATPKEMSSEKSDTFCIRFLKSENIVKNVLVDSPKFYIETEINEKSLKRSQLNKRDILFVIAGASIGKTAMMQDEFLPSNTNQAMAFLRISEQKTEFGKYIWYFLQSSFINTIITLYSVQSAQPNLSMENLGNIRIPISKKIEEVKNIIDYLDDKCSEIDKLIAKKEELLADLDSYKKSLIYEYVTGKKAVE